MPQARQAADRRELWIRNLCVRECHLLNLEHGLRSLLDPASSALDPKRIQMLIWNMLKGSRAGWPHELIRYASGQDLLLLQEVALNDTLSEHLSHAGLNYDLAVAFERRVPIQSRHW